MAMQLSNYFSSEDKLEIIRTTRDLPPAHYTFRIESFSSLADLKTDSLESGDFEVDGYKWNILFYPKGNKKINGDDGYLSMHVVFSESNTTCPGWEVYASFKFLVYDQLQDKYLTIQEGGGRVRRFHKRKTSWGIDKLLPLQYFKDASNGYLMDDICFFGAEICVIKSNGRGESLAFKKLISNNTFTWKIDNFPTLELESYESEEFVIGDQKWKLLVYPKGCGDEKGKSLSLFLEIESGRTLESGRKVYAEFILKIKDQTQGQDLETKGICRHFCSTSKGWGATDVLPLVELNLPSKGYIKDDALVVEVQFNVVSKAQDLP